jgi:ribosome biogenesis GTPase / thiamine phosphate phosphatase
MSRYHLRKMSKLGTSFHESNVIMGKKKLTIQQKNRIHNKQQAYQYLLPGELIQEGLVITRTKNQALIENVCNKERVLCKIRPDIDSLVVGDVVRWQREGENSGVIESVALRQTELSRMDKHGQTKLLASNITQMIVVLAPKPEPSDLLVDSYLIAAELMNLRVSIVFNKTDLDDASHSTEQFFRQQYASLVHTFLSTSKEHPSLKGLEDLLENQKSIFVGQSGVGKSTLIQLILPHMADMIATSPLSTTHEFGQHTTSNAYYFHLPFGGAIIDSPGVRSFKLGNVSAKDILWGFKEFRPFIGNCHFRDCDHQTSPKCAILEALKNNQLSEKRYQNYVKLTQ